MMISFRPSSFLKEDILAAVEAMSHPYAFSGLMRRQLEDFFCEYTGRKYAIAVRDITMAFLLTLNYIGIEKPAKVILSPLSLNQHLSPYIKLFGLETIYCDVERWFLNIDVKRLQSLLTEDVKLIIGSNSLGNPLDWDSLISVVDSKNIFLIEDSRETMFSKYKGKPVGSFGYVSFLEFSESSIVTGYGGVVLTDDKLIYQRLREGCLGLDDIMSSIALSQLKQLDNKIRLRAEMSDIFSNYLMGVEGLKAQYPPKYATDVCWSYFSVHFGKRYSHEARKLIAELMYDDGVEVREYPLSQDLVEGSRVDYLHIAHEVSTRTLLLPFHENLTDRDIQFVCERLKEHSIQIGAGSRDN